MMNTAIQRAGGLKLHKFYFVQREFKKLKTSSIMERKKIIYECNR